MVNEAEEQTNLEKERMKYTILAANPKLYMQLFGEEDEEDSDIEWITPTTAEEMDEVKRIVQAAHSGGESFTD